MGEGGSGRLGSYSLRFCGFFSMGFVGRIRGCGVGIWGTRSCEISLFLFVSEEDFFGLTGWVFMGESARGMT